MSVTLSDAKTPEAGAAVQASAQGAPGRVTSLRSTLLRRTLPLLTLVWALMAALAYQAALKQTNQLFDSAMEQSSEILFSLAHHEMDEIKQVGQHQDRYAESLTFQVWDDQGQLQFHSQGAPGARLSQLANGFSDVTVDRQGWRVYAYHEANDNVYLMIAERLSVRRDLALGLALRDMIPFALALPLIAWVLTRSVDASLRPMEKVVSHLRELAAARLEPISGEQMPAEIQPMVEAMNALFERLRAAYEHERRFTADAAHELRTPLAALKVNAQVLLTGEIDDERRHRLQRVVLAANRCESLLAQLLTLARLEAGGNQHPLRAVPLARLAHEVVSELSSELLDKDIEIELPAAGGAGDRVSVMGDREMLRILLRNLLDNALRYSPPQSHVAVVLEALEDGSVRLAVIDSGPGIAAEYRARAFDRFFRLPGSQGSGSGLGLSIVSRIACHHGARVQLLEGPAGKGLAVELRFPPVGVGA